MKTIACLLLSIVALACHGQERYVTLTIKFLPDYPWMTNSLSLAAGETAHLISMAPFLRGSRTYAYVEKDEQVFSLADGPTQSWVAPGTPTLSMFPTPPAIAGPAKLMLVGQGGGLATFRITPNFSDPQKTIIVLPGAENAAQITLQCSTNLSTWVPATNGLYSGDVAKFFRIHLEKAKP